MKTGDWRWQSAIAATALVVTQRAVMPVPTQTISASAAAPVGVAQAVSANTVPTLESSSTDSRWCHFESINGIVSHIDRQLVKPQPGAAIDANSHAVHFRLLRNMLPDFTIRTADGQPIRSSVEQVVLDYA